MMHISILNTYLSAKSKHDCLGDDVADVVIVLSIDALIIHYYPFLSNYVFFQEK